MDAKQLREEIKLRLEEQMFPGFARKTWPGFVDGWFYRHLFRQMQGFYFGFIGGARPKLKVSVPPRHGKSESVIRFCLYCMMNDKAEIIYTTYSQLQANRLSSKAMDLAKQLGVYNKGGVQEWSTKNGGCFRAVGRGGGLTGSGADILILDDMLKNSEEADSVTIREKLWDFYTTTAETRLSPKGSQIAIGTRWHLDDLLGRLEWPTVVYSAIAESRDNFREVGEALHEARFPRDVLAQVRLKISTRFWNALYQQRPISLEGSIIKDCRVVGESAIPPWGCGTDFVSVDCAFKGTAKSDFNAIQRWRIDWPNMYCIDALNIRCGFSGLLDALRLFIKPTDFATLVEEKANGAAIIEKLSEIFPSVIPIIPTESKTARLEACSPMFAVGNVAFLDSIPCLCDIKEQLFSFPLGANDDQVDACSQALNWARLRNLECAPAQSIKPWWY